MIYDCNVILIFIACMLLVSLVFGKKEGFGIDPHDRTDFIPYIPQDIVCLILKASGVDIDALGIIQDKCQSKEDKKKPDNSNICRI